MSPLRFSFQRSLSREEGVNSSFFFLGPSFRCSPLGLALNVAVDYGEGPQRVRNKRASAVLMETLRGSVISWEVALHPEGKCASPDPWAQGLGGAFVAKRGHQQVPAGFQLFLIQQLEGGKHVTSEKHPPKPKARRCPGPAAQAQLRWWPSGRGATLAPRPSAPAVHFSALPRGLGPWVLNPTVTKPEQRKTAQKRPGRNLAK